MPTSQDHNKGASFDIDLTPLFHKAYEGESGSIAQKLFEKVDYSRLNNIIGEKLAELIPEQYKKVFKSYNPDICTDYNACAQSIALDKHFPIRFYDFGALGFRPKEIIQTFNNSLKEKNYVPEISEVCIIDSSQWVIKSLLNENGQYDSSIDITCAQPADFKEVKIPSLYEYIGRYQDQHTPDGELIEQDERDYATCRTNLEKRIFALLGRTINNFSNPAQDLIDIFYDNMSPLDILVVEGRGSYSSEKCDSNEDYSESLEFMRKHAEVNLGIGPHYTNNGNSVKIRNIDGAIYAYLTLEKDLTDEEGILSLEKGETYKKGTSVLLAYNKPLDLEEFSFGTWYMGLDKLATQKVGEDHIFYLKKNPNPMISCDWD